MLKINFLGIKGEEGVRFFFLIYLSIFNLIYLSIACTASEFIAN